jgi:hypothetical protein
VTRLSIVGLASVGVVGLLSLMVTWWFGPIDAVKANRFAPAVFDARDIVPIGYAAFAVSLGVTAGMLLRRTLPAMAVTLAAFLGARLAFTFWARPHLMTPEHVDMPLTAGGLGFGPSAAGVTVFVEPPSIANAWVISTEIVGQQGNVATSQVLHQFIESACPTIANLTENGQAGRAPADASVFRNCADQLAGSFHLAVNYQPADRYWTFQWIELAIFAGLTGILVGCCIWWTRRRLI